MDMAWPAGALFATIVTAAAQPNMVLLFVDDLGYADVGYNGCTDIPTPHIDSIASNGVICDKGYVSAPVCAPSRAGLLTGRYPTGIVGKWHEGRRTLAAMVCSLDMNIGRFLKALEKHGLDENTLVIFISDNGGKPGIPGKIESGGGASNFSLNTPLHGKKGQLHEGGIRQSHSTYCRPSSPRQAIRLPRIGNWLNRKTSRWSYTELPPTRTNPAI